MKTFQQRLSARLADAFASVLGVAPADINPAIRPATDAKFGDYQSNAAMALAKKAGRKPFDLAKAAVAAAKLDDLTEPPEVAGPGFINLRLKDEVLSAAMAAMSADERLAVERVEKPESVVVDFSSPNISKEMHIGHLRSTVLGDVLARVLEFAGHTVHRQNHVGDWGTQFGMLVANLRQKAAAKSAGLKGELALSDLEGFYREAKQRFDSDPDFAVEARRTVTLLQSGDPEVLDYWSRFRAVSLAHLGALYSRLAVSRNGDSSLMVEPPILRGESAYNDDLPEVVKELKAKLGPTGEFKESESAQCVFLDGFVNKEGNPRPFIVQKSDGGFLYATTDLAALRFRVKTFKPNRILYVVDSRQADHFSYMFAVARKAGFAPADLQLVYVPFGTIQGADGKPFKTKSGESVKMADVLDEAIARARKIVDKKNPELAEADRAAVAEAVGIGAIKYFDLSNNRVTDYRFDWDQMLALNGNTAPYLQYAYARVRSIFRKGEVSEAAGAVGSRTVGLAHEKERSLAVHLSRYGETVDAVLVDYRPNILCEYLYELATRFSAFYEQCPVLKAEEPARTDRLMLSALTARVMRHGLETLLGIKVTEQM
jgi:arginyl-tRNA synthetase